MTPYAPTPFADHDPHAGADHDAAFAAASTVTAPSHRSAHAAVATDTPSTRASNDARYEICMRD